MPHPRPLRLALRLLAVSGVALATANCANNNATKLASSGNGVDPKYGVKASPRLYNEGDKIPKGGGRRFSGKPYVVAGESYTPKEDARGYVREGLASWYGSAFHGRMTANGEVFDRHSIAAAHPTLPLPSYARVTNLSNGSSMIVRVNDRGPYHAGRVMDVSEEAAEALGFHRKGTARVRVEYVGKASLAGSDDRKLLATLRTDGHPAGARSAVMMADLGESGDTERFSRSAPPLAYKPAPERQEVEEPARPVRAPIVLASAAVAVPAALQPTAPRTREFKPAPVQTAAVPPSSVKFAPVKVAAAGMTGLNPGMGRGAPSQPPGSGRSAAPARPQVAHAEVRPGSKAVQTIAAAGRRETASPSKPTAAPAERRVAAAHPGPAALPDKAKLAMARLAAQASPDKAAADKGSRPGGKKAEPAPHKTGPGTRYAGIY
jgi:rare lipoprotein A